MAQVLKHMKINRENGKDYLSYQLSDEIDLGEELYFSHSEADLQTCS